MITIASPFRLLRHLHGSLSIILWRGPMTPLRRVLPLLIPCLLLSNVRADTYVSGTIVGETWTSAGSPYYVVGDVLVASLAIEPGVSVLFSSNYVFEVAGVLTAIGTTNQPIVFGPTNALAGWQGLYFNYSTPGSRLVCCVVSNAVNSAVRLLRSAPSFENCTFAYSTAPSLGGGVWADLAGGDLVFSRCLFASNSAPNGGGAWIVAAGANVTFDDCTIASNACPVGNAGGIGVDLYNGTLTFRRSEILNNWSRTSGAGLVANLHITNPLILESCTVQGNIANPNSDGSIGECQGGGIWVSGDATLSRSLIQSNRCQNGNYFGCQAALGAGVFSPAGSLKCNNVTFRGNLATTCGGGISAGAGLAFRSATAAIANCVFLQNGPSTWGGGVWTDSGSVVIVNSTFAYNDTHAVALSGGNAAITNSILFFNNSSGAQLMGTPVVAYSDVQNGFAGQSNINLNPIFRSTTDLTLVAGSRCIDAGHPDISCNDSCFPPSMGGPRNDMGAYGGPLGCQWTLGEAPQIITQPKSQASCLTKDVTFSVGASGSPPLFYQWAFNNSPLLWRTNSTLVLTNLQAANSGPYTVTVSNVYGTITSGPAQLTVYDACIDLRMYAGLTISGQQGATYLLSYTTDLSDTNSWLPLATNVMPAQGWFYLDMDSPFSPGRFYKAVLRP